MLARRVVTTLCLVAALVGAASCTDSGKPCYPQDYRACACPSVAHGFQQCTADGQGYGDCDCSGAIPGVSSGDAGAHEAATPDAASDAEAGALLPFMSPCDKNEQCDTGLCFNFNAKGPHCTKPCKQAAECPPPSGGCSNMGVCKAP